MIPFSKWIEAVSEPQEKAGEGSLDLEKVVEKRLMQMVMNLETDGKGSRQEIIQSIKKIVGGAVQQPQQPQQPQSQPQANMAPTQDAGVV
jgi:hypothetical protein